MGGPPSLFSWGDRLLLSIYADGRSPDGVIAFEGRRSKPVHSGPLSIQSTTSSALAPASKMPHLWGGKGLQLGFTCATL